MEEKAGIYRRMLDVIAQEAFYKYEFDVTTGLINEPIICQNGFILSEMLGLYPPFSFDEMVYRLENIGFKAFRDGQIKQIHSEDLVAIYDSGQRICEMILRSNAPVTYMKQTYIMAQDEKSGHIHAFVIARDITTIKMQEEKTAKEREEFIRQKDEMLENALAQAKKANEAKTAFLFNMSHDIRTPMNAIIGFTDLLSRSLHDQEKAAEYVRKIQSSNTFLLSLINNVLEMARIESGEMKLDESFWNTDDLNEMVYSVFSETIKKKNISFTRSIHVHHTNVYCDTTKIREILLNLLGNAFKYTPAGGSVSMELTELPSQRDGYVIYQTVIEDNGIGMTKEFVSRIFDEFTRERTSTESKVEGSGLGMAIVKGLVELMDGTIDIQSQVGIGTRITVTIPHRFATDQDLAAVKKNECMDDQMDFSGFRILLAEDNDLNAEITEVLLRGYGFSVDRAEDGVICVDMLEKADRGYYDLILMDIQMPNLNGYGATTRIRALSDSSKAEIPIIAMTANAFAEDRLEAKRAGMNAHLPKPINPNEMLKALSMYCRR